MALLRDIFDNYIGTVDTKKDAIEKRNKTNKIKRFLKVSNKKREAKR